MNRVKLALIILCMSGYMQADVTIVGVKNDMDGGILILQGCLEKSGLQVKKPLFDMSRYQGRHYFISPSKRMIEIPALNMPAFLPAQWCIVTNELIKLSVEESGTITKAKVDCFGVDIKGQKKLIGSFEYNPSKDSKKVVLHIKKDGSIVVEDRAQYAPSKPLPLLIKD